MISRVKIINIFGGVLLALTSCSKPEFNCDLKTIEAYAVKKCNTYADNEECVSEVIYLITTSCGINK